MAKLIISAFSFLAALVICGFTLSNLGDLPGAQPELGQKIEFRQGAVLCAQPETNCIRIAGSATIIRSPKNNWRSGEYVFVSREEIGNITVPGDEKLIGYTQQGWVKISQLRFK